MSDRPPQRVVCAAMRMRDGLIVTGVRHFSPDMHAVLKRLYPHQRYCTLVSEQGFVDQYGTFLSRDEAWVIANEQQQVIRPCGGNSRGYLYSENLY